MLDLMAQNIARRWTSLLIHADEISWTTESSGQTLMETPRSEGDPTGFFREAWHWEAGDAVH